MAPTEAKSKKAPTDARILERRAQAAWEYRQRNRAAVNERAKLRMQKSVEYLSPAYPINFCRRRDALKHAPSEIQQEAAHKARQYRQTYNIRLKAHPKPHQEIPPSPKKVKDSPKKTKTAKPTVSAAHPATAKQQSKSRPQPLRAVSPFRSTPVIDYFALQPPYAPATERPPTPPTPTPSGRKPRRATRTPRSLAAIDADDEEDESDENSDDAGPTQYAPESSIHRWWEYLDVDGPLLNKTGHPDYVPERGQQPYFKGGRRYWF
ncbi:hypothetical protein B0H16DRAFT_1741230 [Mycena metata]|uniref:Uncharacterized protein n=1 Tax=Mycena metata TaxID=1033252 RepID=A0AAD7MGP3_9AGAR|nr:hypothetical protein B0H16DRAFT_1741230 [Mycena metata]